MFNDWNTFSIFNIIKLSKILKKNKVKINVVTYFVYIGVNESVISKLSQDINLIY